MACSSTVAAAPAASFRRSAPWPTALAPAAHRRARRHHTAAIAAQLSEAVAALAALPPPPAAAAAASLATLEPLAELSDASFFELVNQANDLVASQLTGLSPLSFAVVLGAGLLTSLSPCTLSVLPLTIGASRLLCWEADLAVQSVCCERCTCSQRAGLQQLVGLLGQAAYRRLLPNLLPSAQATLAGTAAAAAATVQTPACCCGRAPSLLGWPPRWLRWVWPPPCWAERTVRCEVFTGWFGPAAVEQGEGVVGGLCLL